MFTSLSADTIIVAGYLVATLVLGLWLRRRATQSLEHYYLGGRQLPWPLLGVSGMTNWFDLTGTMIITSFLFLLGPRGLYIEFRGGAVIALVFMLLWTGKWHRRSGCMTGPEWYTFRFGTGPSAKLLRLVSALFGIIFTVGQLAYLVRGTSLFLGFFIPSAPMAATVAIMLLSLLYTMLSGYYGVVVNDLLQGAIIIVACIAVSIIGYQMVAGADVLEALAHRVTGNPEWMTSFPGLHTTMPADYQAYEALLMFAAFYLARAMTDGAGSGDDTRYFAAKNDRECGLLSSLQMVMVAFRWPMMMGFAVIGIFIVADLLPDRQRTRDASQAIRIHSPQLTQAGWHEFTQDVAAFPEKRPELSAALERTLGPRWREALPLVGYHGTVNPEQILPAVVKTSLAPGLKGLVLVAMLAAMMSTLSGTVNGVGSAMFVRDIYQNFLRPHAGNRELIAAAYFATAGIVVIGFYLGLAAQSINHLWGWLMMGFVAGALAPKLLRLYWWRCNALGCAAGIALGGGGAIVQRLWWPELVEWKIFLLTTILGLIGVIVGSLCTPPAPAETVRRFYRQTRPFGFWAPFWKELTPVEKSLWRREHRNDQLALPFTLATQLTLFLMPMQLVIHRFGDFWKTLPVFLVGVLGMYWFWWRNLDALPAIAMSRAGLEKHSSTSAPVSPQ